MRKVGGGLSSILFGTSENVGVGRGLAEFRAGRPVLMSNGEFLITLPVEGLDAKRLAAFRELCEPIRPRLVITGTRARSLGIEANAPVALELTPDIDARTIHALVADAHAHHDLLPEPAGSAASAAIDLVKLAQVLPAVLVADTTPERAANSIRRSSPSRRAPWRGSAPSPLKLCRSRAMRTFRSNSDVRTRFVVFRDQFGDDPVAVIVGTPDFSKPVPVRIHSACLTGDVFGSRRCDCGDQLQLALTRLQEAGGGIILYLAQEGRGVGLANKMRTYKLQDGGLDTVDANTTLGFDDDEREYSVAVRMLQMLGCARVVLLTNNPAKLDGLAKAGIEITGRMPLETPINADNRRYMTAKAARAGHQLGHLMSVLAEAKENEEKAPPLAP